MTIEQKPELNRFVDKSIPLTWAWRWRQIKLTLPIWIFSGVCFLEMGVVKAWQTDRLNLDWVITLIGLLFFTFLFVFGMAELQVRLQQRAKRVLQIEDKRVVISPAKNQFIRWKDVSKFQFEPLPESSGLTKFSVRGFGFRTKASLQDKERWSMVIEQPAQVCEMIQCLDTKRMNSNTNFEVIVSEKPLPPVPIIPFPVLGMSLYMGGLYFLLHGVPLLFAALSGGRHHSDGSSKFSPQASVAFEQFVLKHFSSTEEFHEFFLSLGIGLTIVGIVLLILGWCSMTRASNAAIVSGK